jgi:hypothetical protein
MFKRTMKFDDLEGNEVEQTFYFNYNKKEIAELLGFLYMPLEKMLEKLSTPTNKSGLSQQQNNEQAYQIFQSLILDAYGRKGEDNVTFNKSEDTRRYFRSHVAFVELIFEFLGDEKLAAQFIENCLPPRMVAEAKKDMLSANKGMSEGTLMDMVAEAERRQKDPATRIEPGLDAAVAALDPAPEVVQLAKATASESETKVEDYTPEDVRALSDEDFKKLDVRKLNKDAMLAAFQRKSS